MNLKKFKSDSSSIGFSDNTGVEIKVTTHGAPRILFTFDYPGTLEETLPENAYRYAADNTEDAKLGETVLMLEFSTGNRVLIYEDPEEDSAVCFVWDSLLTEDQPKDGERRSQCASFSDPYLEAMSANEGMRSSDAEDTIETFHRLTFDLWLKEIGTGERISIKIAMKVLRTAFVLAADLYGTEVMAITQAERRTAIGSTLKSYIRNMIHFFQVNK